MTRNVAIINYGLGNLSSVYNAVEFVGGTPFVAESPSDLTKASHAILPGVGAFGEGMQFLNEQGWVADIINFVSQEKPFLGICLGMQLLADSSTEHGLHAGLGLIAGKVDRFTKADGLRIPHIGWNEVKFEKTSKAYDGLNSPEDYYFVHSYIFHANDEKTISGTCNYGQNFVASVEKDNVWGMQFHPEKSQQAGLKIISNWLGL